MVSTIRIGNHSELGRNNLAWNENRTGMRSNLLEESKVEVLNNANHVSQLNNLNLSRRNMLFDQSRDIPLEHSNIDENRHNGMFFTFLIYGYRW